MRDLIKVGIVSSIFPERGTVKVIFVDKENRISQELPMMSFEYDMPKVKDQVLCVFLPNGLDAGFCLGSFYSKPDPVPINDADVHWKVLGEDSYFNINKKTGNANLKLSSLVIDGDVTINGDLKINGSVAISNSLNVGNSIKTNSLKANTISANTITAKVISEG